MKKDIKKKKTIISIVVLIVAMGFFLNFFMKIINEYSSIYVSNTVYESKEVGTFIAEYELEEVYINDSVYLDKPYKAIENIWIEKMWGYKYSLFFFRKEYFFSEGMYLVLKHPSEYIDKTYGCDFKECFFFKKNQDRIFNFSQKEQVIPIDFVENEITLEVYLKSCDTHSSIHIGEVILKKL